MPSTWLFLKYLPRITMASIKKILPKQIGLESKGNLITVLGKRFGPTGSVSLEYYEPVTMEEMQNSPYLTPTKNKKISPRELAELTEDWKEQYRYQSDRLEYWFDITKPAVVTPNLVRQDTRIVVSLDDVIYKLKSKEMNVIVEENGSLSDKVDDAEYVIRVEKDGLLTFANSDATFTITNIPPKTEDLSVSTVVNKQVEIQLKASDPDVGDRLTYNNVSDPPNGTLSNLQSNTGKITYTPKAGFVGEDSLYI